MSEAACQEGAAGRAVRWAEESLSLCRELDDRQGICGALNSLGIAAGMRGNHQAAKQCFTENLVTAQEIGDRCSVAKAFHNLGYTAYLQKEYHEAAYYIQECLAVAKTAGLRQLQAGALATLGLIHTAMGNPGQAWGYLYEGLAESTAFGYLPSTLNALIGVSWLRVQSGDYVQAAELLGLALDHPALEAEAKQDTAAPVLTTLGEQLPPAQLDAALSRGGTADLESVVAGILASYE
jgi:tetratricopeptide (TPR) repeat protein